MTFYIPDPEKTKCVVEYKKPALLVKQVEELIRLGGRFYEIKGVSWCDLPDGSYHLVPGKGYVRYED